MKEHEVELLHNFRLHEKDIYGRQIFMDHEGINYELMKRIDSVITFAKRIYGEKQGAFIVHDINLGDHSTDSYHYRGEAVDGHFRGLNLFQSVQVLFKMCFTGIGIYPDWEHKGIHADIRKQDHVSTWVQHREQYIYDWNFFVEQMEMEMECPCDNNEVYN